MSDRDSVAFGTVARYAVSNDKRGGDAVFDMVASGRGAAGGGNG